MRKREAFHIFIIILLWIIAAAIIICSMRPKSYDENETLHSLHVGQQVQQV